MGSELTGKGGFQKCGAELLLVFEEATVCHTNEWVSRARLIDASEATLKEMKKDYNLEMCNKE